MSAESGTALLLTWIGFLLLGLAAASAILLWSIRNGQFGDQERARHLPLANWNPGDPEMEEEAP